MKNEKLRKNVLLKDYTTFRIGGRARYFFEAENQDEVIEAIKLAKQKNMPFFILGGGSNVLINDKKYKGLVIKMKNEKLKMKNDNEKFLNSEGITVSGANGSWQTIEAEAGVPLGKIVGLALQEGLTGMEWAIGIPGTIGGAVYSNAGAFGSAMGDNIEEVEAIDFENQELRIRNYEKEECKFKYRESIFKKNKNLIILSAKIKLQTPLEALPLTGQAGNKTEIEKKMADFFKTKKQTQPLEFFSAGSVFKNPEGFCAGELIEKCGLKGKRINGAEISQKHSNFIVNNGRAKAKDVKKLIDLIKKQVKKKFNIILEEEIQLINF